MKKMSRQTRPHKPSKLEAIVAATARDWGHANSTIINSRIRILQFESEEAWKSIIALSAARDMLRERRATLGAMLTGLSEVLAKR